MVVYFGERILHKFRAPIATQLFFAVLLSTLIITFAGLALLQLGMQKGFSRYVAELEMQRLDTLMERLVTLYEQYGSWPAALDADRQRIMKKGEVVDEGFEKRWLHRQHEKVLREIMRTKMQEMEHARISQLQSQAALEGRTFKLPPFMPGNMKEGYPPPPDFDREGAPMPPPDQRPFFPFQDRLGMGQRMVLYDANYHYVAGIQTSEKLPTRQIMINGIVVGYLALKPADVPDDSLSISFFKAQSRYLGWIYFICLIVSAIVAMLLAAHFRKPIQALLLAASELTKGNYQQHIETVRRDELGDLAASINRLSHILDQHEQSRKQWVADTSHELRTPISVLQVQIEALQDGIRKPSPAHFEAMQRQVLTLRKLVEDLNELAKGDVGQLNCNFLNANPWFIVAQELDSFKEKFAAKQIVLKAVPPKSELTLLIDPDRFRQVVANLLENSWRYTDEGGQVNVSVHMEPEFWALYVDDSYPNVPEEALQQLGERFYRVDHSRARATGGTGLGLALSQQIVEIHAGSLQFLHSPLGGLRVILRLPLTNDSVKN
jgi:two-component system sensor histidine kinase BaeS